MCCKIAALHLLIRRDLIYLTVSDRFEELYTPGGSLPLPRVKYGRAKTPIMGISQMITGTFALWLLELSSRILSGMNLYISIY